MPNSFDQFDSSGTAVAEPPQANSFDQFDQTQNSFDKFDASSTPTAAPAPDNTLPDGLTDADVDRGPLSLLVHHPIKVIGGALKQGGDIARSAVSDAMTTLTGHPDYGGNLEQFQQNIATGSDQPLPADQIINSIAKSNPNLAVASNVAQGAVGAAPLAVLGALPAALARAAALGFSAQMIAGVKDTASQLGDEMGKPADQQDPAKIAQLKADLIQTGVFAPLAAAGGAGKLISDRLTPKPNETTTPEQPSEPSAAASEAATSPVAPVDTGISQPVGQTGIQPETPANALDEEENLILQPAIRVDDKVLTGGGNGHIGVVMSHADDLPSLPNDFMGNAAGMSGFVDKDGNFYTRQEAAKALGSETPMTSEDLPNYDPNAEPPAKQVLPFKSIADQKTSGEEIGKSIGAKFDGEFDLGTGPVRQFTYTGDNFQGDENTPHYGTTFQMPADATLEQAKGQGSGSKRPIFKSG